jgi:hypothetical protein
MPGRMRDIAFYNGWTGAIAPAYPGNLTLRHGELYERIVEFYKRPGACYERNGASYERPVK